MKSVQKIKNKKLTKVLKSYEKKNQGYRNITEYIYLNCDFLAYLYLLYCIANTRMSYGKQIDRNA